MSEQFLAELERKLTDLIDEPYRRLDGLHAIAREVAVELEKVRLARRGDR